MLGHMRVPLFPPVRGATLPQAPGAHLIPECLTWQAARSSTARQAGHSIGRQSAAANSRRCLRGFSTAQIV